MLVHGWPIEKIPPLNDQISLEAQLYNYTTKKRQISVLFCFLNYSSSLLPVVIFSAVILMTGFTLIRPVGEKH